MGIQFSVLSPPSHKMQRGRRKMRVKNNKINLLPCKTQGGEETKVVRIKRPPCFDGAMIVNCNKNPP